MRIVNIGYDKTTVIKEREVVDLVINNYDTSDTYAREEIDAFLDDKLDVPTAEDWGNFELILTL